MRGRDEGHQPRRSGGAGVAGGPHPVVEEATQLAAAGQGKE